MNFAMETLIFGRRCFLDPPVISPHTANLNKSPNSKIYLVPGFQMRRALEKSPRSLGTHCTPGLGPSQVWVQVATLVTPFTLRMVLRRVCIDHLSCFTAEVQGREGSRGHLLGIQNLNAGSLELGRFHLIAAHTTSFTLLRL